MGSSHVVNWCRSLTRALLARESVAVAIAAVAGLVREPVVEQGVLGIIHVERPGGVPDGVALQLCA